MIPAGDPVLVKSNVFRCYGCKRWLCRTPGWTNGDGIGGCEYCGCTSYTTHEGRPYGPKSSWWPLVLQEWRETIRPLLEGESDGEMSQEILGSMVFAKEG